MSPKKYTDRDLERAMRIAVEGDHMAPFRGYDADLQNFSVADLAELLTDERERFATMCENFARRVGIMRSLGATHEARAANELAELIRADRGGQ